MLSRTRCLSLSVISKLQRRASVSQIHLFPLLQRPPAQVQSLASASDQHSYNDRKLEMIAKQANNDNPFDNYTIRPDTSIGLFESSPILIPSVGSSRVVGCCCEDDYQEIVWFQLNKGEVQKCDCGNYFKLVEYDPLDPNIRPSFGEGFGSGMGTTIYWLGLTGVLYTNDYSSICYWAEASYTTKRKWEAVYGRCTRLTNEKCFITEKRNWWINHAVIMRENSW